MKRLISKSECKNIQIGLLKQLDKVCGVYDVTYYLGYGSLLGAVRHKGIIPWDDDIDVYMDRKDYEKLIEIIKRGMTSLTLIDSDTDGYYYPFAKLVDCSTIAKMDDNTTKHGVWLDLFPIDGLPNNKILADCHIKLCQLMRAVIISMTTDFDSNKLGKKSGPKKIFNFCADFIGRDKICKWDEKLMKLYSKKRTKYVACLFSPYGKREKEESNILFQVGQVMFEGGLFNSTKDCDRYLRRIYGDYMMPPSKDKQVAHSIKAWHVDEELR